MTYHLSHQVPFFPLLTLKSFMTWIFRSLKHFLKTRKCANQFKFSLLIFTDAIRLTLENHSAWKIGDDNEWFCYVSLWCIITEKCSLEALYSLIPFIFPWKFRTILCQEKLNPIDFLALLRRKAPYTIFYSNWIKIQP